MQSIQAVHQVIRNRLTQSANLTAMVASNCIRVSLQTEPTTYPAIRVRITGVKGANLSQFLSGNIYFGIYTNNQSAPSGHLASIYNIVKGLIDEQQSTLHTSCLAIGRISEQFCEYPVYQEETGFYYLTARYGYTAQHLK